MRVADSRSRDAGDDVTKFYKGAGVGTYYHANDARLVGFSARSPAASSGVHDLVNHIARATTYSPFISLTRSFGVARDYAVNASMTRPTASSPANVYEVDLDDRTRGVHVFDPVLEIAKANGNPFASPSYHHDGAQSFLLGVIDPVTMSSHLAAPAPQLRALSGGTVRPPTLSGALEAIVRALRDAEIIVLRTIPASCVGRVYHEY